MTKLRVLHVVQTPLDFVGGPATYVKELAKHLACKGVTVGIIAPRPRRTEEIDELISRYRISFYPITLPHPLEPMLRDPWVFSVKAYKVLNKIIGEYDIVNVHVESIFLQRSTKTSRKPIVVTTVHGFPLYEDYEALKSKLDIYKILHLIFIAPQHYLSLLRLIRDSKAIVTVSRYLKELVVGLSRSIEYKVFVIPNAVDTNFFKPIEQNVTHVVVRNIIQMKCGKTIHNENIVLYIGRMEPRKGVDILLKSLSKVQTGSWFLLLVGEGQPNYVNYLKHLASKFNIRDKTCFIGKVSHHLLPYFYSAAYLYVLPSLFEGLPATILEAMSCGTPVIASRVGGIPEAIINGINGILVDPGSSEQLRNALEYVLFDPDYRNKLSKAALDTVRKKFSWNNMANQYYELYEALLSEIP